MATLTGKIIDVTSRPPDSISSITVKAPSARIGSGTDVIVSSPAEVTFDKTTGDITISGLTGGLSWLYIEGDGWSDSIALAVAEGMTTLVEAVANAIGAPGMVDYVRLLEALETAVGDVAQDAVDDAADGIKWVRGLVPAGTTSIDELEDGSWVVGSASLSTTLGLPVVGIGHLVKRSVLGGVTAQWTTMAGPTWTPETWFTSTTGSGVWGDWVKVATKNYVDDTKWVRGAVPAGTTSIDELEDGSWAVGSATLSGNLGLPVVGMGHLVKRTVFGGVTAQWTTMAGPTWTPETWFTSTTGSGVWGDWVKIGTSEDSTSSKHEVLVADLKARRGGRQITKGGAVSIVVDHGTNGFNEVYLPMLRARGMAATIALNSDMYNPENYRYEFDNRTSWDIVRGWYENDGIEIANHGRTHATTSEDEAYDEIVGGLEELKTFLPNVPIDTFVTHGGLGSGMPDYNHGRDIEVFYDTVAGRLIHEHHACSVSGATPQTFPLTGDPYVGVYRYWVETPALINTAKTAIQNAIDRNHGVVISFHPETMTGEGKATTAEFEAFLDWIKSFIDAGELTMLTLRDMMVSEYSADPKEVALKADKSYVDQRAPLLSFAGTGSPEGNVSAPVGSTYTDTAATNGAVRWIKTSGTGNTGWVVEYGDTNVRSLPRPEVFDGGIFSVSRNGDYVHLVIHAATLASTISAWDTFMTLPPGFRTATTFRIQAQDAYLDVRTDGRLLQLSTDLSAGKIVSLGVVYQTSDPWPSTLPGTPF